MYDADFWLLKCISKSALIKMHMLFYMSNPSSLTCMRPHVGLEVGALEVGLVAVLIGTNMTAYTGNFWLRRALPLLQHGTARCGGDGW